MPRITGIYVHAMLLAVALAAVLPTRLALKRNYAQQRRALQTKAFSERSAELAKFWSKYAYTNGTGNALAETVLGKLDWPALQITEVQQTRLKSRLREVFGYLSQPDFDEYRRLKTEGLSYQLVFNQLASNYLTGVTLITKDSGTALPLLKTLWDEVSTLKPNQGPVGIIGVSLDYVRAVTSCTNSHNTILKGKASIGFSVIGEALEPGFHYGGQTNAVSDDTAQGLFLHLSFFARSNVSTNPGPIYLSLYWSEADEKWALSRLFADRLLNLHTLF